ncbi:ABC transporter ATP-binding protein [Prochlorococcus sp. MIT 1223]|uniref:ABC transporter ATP-binding protein n=1 Tax=Prochlorococcus sp. MIT 1223 TaxID=3096217 RepID=UPI002A7604C4|nr:ABC transporter ATP-binding protein [Prochlorococcus sp. MIT 1223]
MAYQRVFNFKYILELLRPHINELVLGGISMFVYVLCWPLLAWLAGKLIPAIGEGNLEQVIKVIFLALIVFLVQKLSQFSQDILFAKPALSISQNLRTSLFSKLQKIELVSLEKLSCGDITYRLTEDADRIGEVIYKTIQDTTPSFLQLVAVLVYMIFLDWKLSMATLLLAPIMTLLISKFGQKVMLTAERSQERVSELASLLGEAIQGLPLIRAFAVEDWMQERFDAQVKSHKNARFKTLKLLALQHPVIGFLEAAGILTILTLGAARIQQGGLNGEQFSSYFAALLMLIDPISHLTTNFNELQQGQASLRRLKEIHLEAEENINNKSKVSISSRIGNIDFNEVSFSYKLNKKVIDSLSLTIERGKKIAFVGPSGAGKSTLFSLLLGFIKPTSGSIKIDGIEMSTLNTKHLRRQIALVPQVSTVFSGSINQAISFGRVCSEEQIINSAKIANAHEFITNMKDGYQTVLQERGTNLSGGQLQRISIARALVGDPSILLLDEATSALDADSEEEVQLALKQAMKSRTVIIIAHRLSTVQEADLIVFIDKGRILEVGKHSDLIKLSGKYSELCNKQFINK